ncbi:hypothetical protein SLEP1_g56713 [Rubroshorea leprosula]|uniref:Uncharacterized protein n=1 Tax=Rubroshorea leprosula TaxID=152421 RepID=A0AAV5MKB7_9ROSI|nr:hypothetical protein SLEP1_g56713 [Rubroshorea leprosula]
MVSLRELTEQRGNHGREGEEEGVLSVEPITMIVPPELQDSPETMAPERSTSSSARDDGGDHATASSSSSSTEETPSREEGMGDVVSSVSDRPVIGEWEGVTIPGRLSNLRKAPKDLPIGFRFKAVLHHEVANCAPSISGYKRLEEMVRAFHIPKTILLWTGRQNERACTVSQTGWIPVYVDHFDDGLRFPLPGLVFDLLADYELALTSLFQCRLCPNSRGAKWYYLSWRDKSQLFKNVRNKVARWKRQFIFVRDTRTERISNDLAARLSEWRTPNAHINYPQLLPRDVDLKNKLLEYAKRKGLIDLKALVTSEQLVVFGFVDVANLFTEAQSSRGRGASSGQQSQTRFDEQPPPAPLSRSSSHRGSSLTSRPRADQRADVAAPNARRRAQEGTESEEDEIPLARRRTSGGTQPVQAARPATVRSPTAPPATTRVVAEPISASASTSGPRIAYPEGFSYVRAECQPAMVQAMHNFVPPSDSRRAEAFVQQHGGQVAMIKLMDAFSYAVALYEGEQEARTQNGELGSKCKQLAIEKASLVDDVNRLQGSEMANRAAAAESQADELANRNNELREELEHAQAKKESGIQAAKDEAARVEERAKKAETDRDRAQHELSSLRHQVAEVDRNLAAAKEALNELKASHARSVSIARAQGAEWWDLNEEGVPVWPPQVLEDGEDPTGLPSFDAWVEGAPVAEQEPSTTPPNSQPTVVPVSSPVSAPVSEAAARSPPTRSPAAAADASMPVDLTDD